MLCRLDLSDLPEYIRVLSANTQSVKLLDELINELGEAPEHWLASFFERSAS
jgi:type IV secretion system protein VirB4